MRMKVPCNNTWERRVRSSDAKERAKILCTTRNVSDVDTESNQEHRKTSEDEWRAHLDAVRDVSENEERNR